MNTPAIDTLSGIEQALAAASESVRSRVLPILEGLFPSFPAEQGQRFFEALQLACCAQEPPQEPVAVLCRLLSAQPELPLTLWTDSVAFMAWCDPSL